MGTCKHSAVLMDGEIGEIGAKALQDQGQTMICSTGGRQLQMIVF